MILKNYISRDIYKSTSAILLVLILIFVSSRFVKYIQLAVEGVISAKAVFVLLTLQIPSIAGFLIPLSFFIAILLTFGRLYSENELVVVHSVGIGQRELAKMLMPMALMFALIAGGLSTLLTPWAIAQGKILMAEQAAHAKLGIFSAGRFKENSNKDGVVFVETKSDDGIIHGVFSVSRSELKVKDDSINQSSINQPSLNQSPVTLKIQTALNGKQWEDKKTGVNYLVLEDGQFSEFNQKQNAWQITDFDSTYSRIIQEDSLEVKSSVKATSTFDLLKDLGNSQWAALHWRLAAPLSIPLICLLAISLSRGQPRQGKFTRLLPSIMIYLFYVLLMMYSRKLIESGKIPGELGFWWIHAGLAAFVYWLYRPLKSRSAKIKNTTKVTQKNSIKESHHDV